MGLRICLVTPFAWSQPHEVNDHVAGVARGLRHLGHRVTVLAPSNRSRDLRAGRRALQRAVLDDVVAVGPAVPVSRRSLVAVPVGLRANLALALSAGEFDVVHGFEPALPSLSYLALRETDALSVATFFSEERLLYPPSKVQRERLLTRIDALLAVSWQVADAAARRLPGDYTLVSGGVDSELFRPEPKRRRIVVEVSPGERGPARIVLRMLDGLPDWELVLLKSLPFASRPYVPLRLRDRVHLRTGRDAGSRAEILNRASIFVPARDGSLQLALEASAAGAASADGVEQAEPTAASVTRLAQDEELCARLGAEARVSAEKESFAAVAAHLDSIYSGLAGRRRSHRAHADPLGDRDWIVCDLHTHTSWSYDCSVSVSDLLDEAESRGLGAIAVTDHNAFGGALEAVELARGRSVIVIAGEEIKTKGQGELIGLFLHEEIPRGLSFGDTISAIREQGGLVYVPHPFDRRHAIPDPATLHRHLADIDVFEAYNARLLFDAYNDEATRFARKYNLLRGAGSDAHVLPGLGTGAVRMRAFRNAEEFLISLHSAQLLRRPKSLAYLQSLKWVAQVKEKVR